MTNRFTEQKKQRMLINLYKQNQLKRYAISGCKKTKFETVDDRIVLYRLLGHFEIPNAHVWKIDTGGWIGDKWKYTCVIVNPATIEGTFKTSDQIQTEYFHQKIIDNNKISDLKQRGDNKDDTEGKILDKVFLCSNLDIIANDNTAPKIAGSFNNWKCTTMMKIDKFYDGLMRNTLPAARSYVEDEPVLMTKISKILNQEIFNIFRNQKGFVAHRRPTIINKLLEEQRNRKSKGKKIKEKVVFDIKDIHL